MYFITMEGRFVIRKLIVFRSLRTAHVYFFHHALTRRIHSGLLSGMAASAPDNIMQSLGLESDGSSSSGSDDEATGGGGGGGGSGSEPTKARGRPKGSGVGISKTDFKGVMVREFVDFKEAKAWRLQQPFMLRAGENNKYRTVWQCKSHEDDEGQPCCFEVAAFNCPGGKVQYWHSNDGGYHSAIAIEADPNRDGIAHEHLAYVDAMVRGGMKPDKILTEIVIAAGSDKAKKKIVPALSQVRLA